MFRFNYITFAMSGPFVSYSIVWASFIVLFIQFEYNVHGSFISDCVYFNISTFTDAWSSYKFI